MPDILLTPDNENTGMRIDRYIADNSDISRSYCAKLCEQGLVYAGEKCADKKYKIKGGENIKIMLPEPEITKIEPEDIWLDIVYEDDDLLVVNKPQGMVVHPAPGNMSHTLVNALMYHCRENLSAINGVIRPGIVHRIDKDTSGLLVVAKNNETHLALSAQLKERKTLRKYYALVNGNIKEEEGTINKPIDRNPSDRKKMAICAGGREAVTHYRVIQRFGQYTFIECILETGRTHQIRVHMQSIGHSIVGDKVYGIKKEKFNLQGQLLHAATIGFIHPKNGENMMFSAPIPQYFINVLEKLQRNA